MSILGAWYDWPYSQSKTGTVDLTLEQYKYIEFYSKNHRRQGNGWDGGGEFLSKKSFVRHTPSAPFVLRPYGKLMYNGSVYANPPQPPVFREPLDLLNFGPTAYRRANPDNNPMDLANSLYELKDVYGMAKQVKDTRDRFKTPVPLRDRNFTLGQVSNFHLAVAFGWLPLLADCINLYQTQKRMSAVIKQLKRDNGRPVRRRVQMHDQTVNSSELISSGTDPYGTNLAPVFITQCYAGGSWELSLHETRKMWVSGQFRSWLPDQGDLSDNQWDTEISKRLFGLSPTPSRVYKAMPWSWLIDWFSNVGDNFANMTTNVADCQINDYCYLMRTTEQFARLTVNQGFNAENDEVYLSRSITESGTSLKERIYASPFGFGIKIPDLSPFQLTILGSLGGKSIGRFG